MTMPYLIGLGIAYAIYEWGDTAKYDLRIADMKKVDLHFLYLGVFMYGVLV